MVEIQPIGTLLRTDKDGFLVNESSPSKIVEPWLKAVNAAVSIYQELFGNRLHSVYVRGTVSRGMAIENISDVDTFAVVEGDITEEEAGEISRRQASLKEAFTFTDKVELDAYPLTPLLTEADRYYSKRFTIKCRGCCVYGTSLAPDISGFKPDWEMAYRLHKNPEEWVDRALRICHEEGKSPDRINRLSTWTAKNMLRTGYALVFPIDRTYTRDLWPCYDSFSRHYPERSKEMHRALNLALNPTNDVTMLSTFVTKFGGWLAEEFNRVVVAQFLSSPTKE